MLYFRQTAPCVPEYSMYVLSIPDNMPRISGVGYSEVFGTFGSQYAAYPGVLSILEGRYPAHPEVLSISPGRHHADRGVLIISGCR